jgi:hypothetical protein
MCWISLPFDAPHRDAAAAAKDLGTSLLRRSVSVLWSVQAIMEDAFAAVRHGQAGLFSRCQFGQDTPPFCV